jgi:3-oxoacyl-[acyl-carrier protein] reductase
VTRCIRGLVDLGLRGKVALVGAASKGMGRATAFSLAREGCKVAICARNPGPLEDALRAIRAETKADVLAIPADLSQATGVAAFVEGAKRAFGGIDILVANAGGPATGSFEAVTEEQWDQAWNLTFQSTARLVRACVPSMRQRGGGAIVAVLSYAVRTPIDNLVLSNSVRLGVVGLLKTLTRELAKDRIRVNGLAPGAIATERLVELHRNRAEREGRRLEDVQADETREIPLGRFGTPEEIANVIAFVVSPRASYLTGIILQVDGGMYRGIF